MKHVAIIGGETHIYEVTQLHEKSLEIVATCMSKEHREQVLPELDAPNYISVDEMLSRSNPEIVAIANENDLKHLAIMRSLEAGCDVIVDKPLCITMDEQIELEHYLAANTQRRLLNLLTLRADPIWNGLRSHVANNQIGEPAFLRIRMAVQLKRDSRPAWFLDSRRSGGLFLDLLIHGLDQVEWLSSSRITAVTANMGNLGDKTDPYLSDHAAVYCELENGGSAVVEGQRMLPGTKGSDYRATVAGTHGFADLVMFPPSLTITNSNGADVHIEEFTECSSVVADWLVGGEIVPQEASLRANRLALLVTLSAKEHSRINV